MARILVAEDDDNVRAFVTRALTHMGHEVTEAEDGGIAAEICTEKQGAFDLLLSDIVMPGGMSGVELAQAARELRPGTAVLLASGYAPEALGPNAAVGAFELVHKPYDPETVARRLMELLARRKAHAQAGRNLET